MFKCYPLIPKVIKSQETGGDLHYLTVHILWLGKCYIVKYPYNKIDGYIDEKYN